MGTVIQFPEERDGRGRVASAQEEPASVIILPVIRIERLPDEPSGFESGPGAGRRRRRRASRS